MNRRVPLVVLVVVVLGLAVGCSESKENFNTVGMSISGAADGGASGEGAADSGGDAAAEKAAVAEVPDGAEVPGVRREVIYKADMVVRVDDVEKAADQARDLVTEAGGFVGQQTSTLEGDREVSITLRIPVGDFDAVLGDLAELGEVLEKQLDAQDVTDQVVDLEVRISRTEVSAQRLRELLAEADGVLNLLAIETELTNRETQIEQMKGQLQVLRDQVDMSTVTVSFTEDQATDPEVADDLPGFAKAFRAGGVAVANVGLVLVAALGFLLPFSPILIAAWFGRRWWRRRHPKAPKPTYTPPGWVVGPTGPGVPGGGGAHGGAASWLPAPPSTEAATPVPEGSADRDEAEPVDSDTTDGPDS
ncbi:MAG: DUF4349 domain-containing protein [Microthrixaceae bacterium]|nr:DUF4349 domain-containing protein [Acidimicrobiales bacterium]MCB9403714.1 DUF4349 domain-containing protein [Microthrixaceae bacterium]